MSGSGESALEGVPAGRSGVSWVMDRMDAAKAPVWIAWMATARAKTATRLENTRPMRDQRIGLRALGSR